MVALFSEGKAARRGRLITCRAFLREVVAFALHG